MALSFFAKEIEIHLVHLGSNAVHRDLTILSKLTIVEIEFEVKITSVLKTYLFCDRWKSRKEGWFCGGSFSKLIKQCMFCCFKIVYSSTLSEKYLMWITKNYFSQLAQSIGYLSCVNLFQRGLFGAQNCKLIKCWFSFDRMQFLLRLKSLLKWVIVLVFGKV